MPAETRGPLSSAPTSPGATPGLQSTPSHVNASPPNLLTSGPPPAAGPHPVPHHEPPIDPRPLPWLFALALSGLLVQIVLRPLRRFVTLQHLRESLWSESIDQRASNLWQLVLVGLRDAGWHAAPGEQPLALARRADVPGADMCAIVLERARHGSRLETRDLQAMTDAAQVAYHAARQRTGRMARALSWLRWPLV
jgi:hypothetical protein